MLRILLSLSILTATLVGAPPRAEASWPESLVMPGELVAKHARYERPCNKCHEPLDKAGQDRLCLDCHKEVAADLGAKR